MKIITNAPIILQGQNGDTTYSKGTQNEYGEGDSEFDDYIFTQKESGYYSIDGELYHFNGEENSFSSVEGFVPISVVGNSVISVNSDDFYNAEGDTEQVYLGADGEEYFSADGENFYNAKGQKILGAFKAVGKGIGKGAKGIGKGIGKGAKGIGKGIGKGAKAIASAGKWVGGKIKKFVGKLKPKNREARPLAKWIQSKKEARKVNKGAKDLVKLGQGRRDEKQAFKDKTFKDEKAKAQAQVVYEKQGEKASKILEKQRIDNENLAKQRAQEIEDIKNRKYDRDKEKKELAKMQAKVDKDNAEAEVERKRVEKARDAEIERQIAPLEKTTQPNPNTGGEKYVDPLPPVIDGQKTLPDGSKVAVNPNETEKGADGKLYDKKDLNGTGETKVITNEETGKQELVKIVDSKDVTNLTSQDGEIIPFKNSDLGDNKEGMSKGLKIGLIVGGAVLVLGIIGYLIYRSRNKGK
jgi:hypothetical protein